MPKKPAKNSRYEKHVNPHKRMMPFLHPSINPAHLRFDPNDPSKSAIIDSKIYMNTITVNGKRYGIYGNLGNGTFATVDLVQDLQTNEWLALKTPDPTASDAADIAQEIKGLKASGEFIACTSTDPTAFLIKLQEGEELHQIMKSKRPLSQLEWLILGKDILTQFAYLHKSAHLLQSNDPSKQNNLKRTPVLLVDIKPRNILVNMDTYGASLCDFGGTKLLPTHDAPKTVVQLKSMLTDDNGSSTAIKNHQKTLDQLRHDLRYGTNPTLGTHKVKKSDNFVNTEAYIAPELFDDEEFLLNEATESYAIAVIFWQLFELVTHIASEYFPKWDRQVQRLEQTPHPTLTDPDTILAQDAKAREANKPTRQFSAEQKLYLLIWRIGHRDPQKRPTMLQAAIEWNQILHEVGKTASFSVCTLSIDAFLKFIPKQKKALFDALNTAKINTVVLQGNHQTSNEDYYHVRYELKQEQLSIAPFIATGATPMDSLRTIKEHYDGALTTTNTAVYQYQNGVLQQAMIPREKKPKPPRYSNDSLSDDDDNDRDNKRVASPKPKPSMKQPPFAKKYQQLLRDLWVGLMIGMTLAMVLGIIILSSGGGIPLLMMTAGCIAICSGFPLIAGVTGAITRACSRVTKESDPSQADDYSLHDKRFSKNRAHKLLQKTLPPSKSSNLSRAMETSEQTHKKTPVHDVTQNKLSRAQTTHDTVQPLHPS